MPGAVHVRKVGIQVSDIVDFGTTSGVSKILGGTGISVSPASGVGAVTVSSTGVTKILAGTAITISPVSGVGDVTVSATAGVDILRSPSGEDQAILPLTDNIPLTIKGFAGGASDVLDIFDAATPTQNKVWQFDSAGDLRMRMFSGNVTGRIRMRNDSNTTNQSILWKSSAGVVRIGDVATDVPSTPDFEVDAGNFKFNVSGVFLNILQGFTSGRFIIFASGTTITFGNVGAIADNLVLAAATSINNNNLAQYLNFRVENLTADPAAATAGRMWDRTDLAQLSWDTGTAIRRIMDEGGGVFSLTGLMTWQRAAGSQIFAVRATADANAGLVVSVSGLMNWGPGGAGAVDTILQRTAAGILQISANPAGTLAQLSLLGTEVGAAERRIRENAGVLEVTDSTPTVLFRIGSNWTDLTAVATPAAPAVNVRRLFVASGTNQAAAETSAGTVVYLEGRGAPNVSIAKSATSLSVTLSPAEPDTSYEIGTTLAFNSTVFYSAKATTGFTLNFGTAPAAASTLDWIVDRRVSGSA